VLPDQRRHWTALYANGHNGLDRPRSNPSGFIRTVAPLLPERASVLELGCGEGEDAACLARLGHDVTACDFVEALIEANEVRHGHTPGLAFRVMRTDEPFPDAEGIFDAVYAHLTLHYFRHEVTTSIFREIERVLAPCGLLAFACKSDQDRLYGQGVMIEPDMFDLDGHVRHFFSEAYARQCLDGAFEIEHLAIRPLDQNAAVSSVLEVIARVR
jgi:SAM-dependent methyltransferase